MLRGDDAFGIKVLHQLQLFPAAENVEFLESGIAGISLVQQLMNRYDALIIIDVLDRGAEPGRVFVLQPDEKSLSGQGISRHQTCTRQIRKRSCEWRMPCTFCPDTYGSLAARQSAATSSVHR